MSKPLYESLDSFFTELENHYGGWPAFRNYFLHCPPQARITDLSAYDQLLEGEIRPSREHAEYIAKRRELGDLHDMMLRAGR